MRLLRLQQIIVKIFRHLIFYCISPMDNTRIVKRITKQTQRILLGSLRKTEILGRKADNVFTTDVKIVVLIAE
jgi:hypothetical protein